MIGIGKGVKLYMEKWIVIVYMDGDKIASHVFEGGSEDELRPLATDWVESNHGKGTDWSFHRVHE